MGTFSMAAQELTTSAPITADAEKYTVWKPGPQLRACGRQLMQLNRQYLALLLLDDEFQSPGILCLRGLSNDALLAMSDCRFSLFTLGFDDSRRWLPMLTCATSETAHYSRPGQRCQSDARVEFVATAIFFAWHLAQTNPLAAKVFLDLDARVTSALQNTSVAQLHALASVAAGFLSPRWPQNRFFWAALVRCSSEPTSAALRATKLLGRQLLAAESLGAASAASNGEGLAQRPRRFAHTQAHSIGV